MAGQDDFWPAFVLACDGRDEAGLDAREVPVGAEVLKALER